MHYLFRTQKVECKISLCGHFDGRHWHRIPNIRFNLNNAGNNSVARFVILDRVGGILKFAPGAKQA